MKRLLATVRCDVTLQLRHGFYYATAFVLIVCVALVSRFPALDLGWLLPALVLGNLLINTFYFIGGLILLEKGEGTLEAQVVTPLRTWEYLASKIGTLTLFGLVENLVIVVLLAGREFSPLPLAASIVLTSALYCLRHCCTWFSGSRGCSTCTRCKPRCCWRKQLFNRRRAGRWFTAFSIQRCGSACWRIWRGALSGASSSPERE
jgi:hypothetical protein